MSYPSVPIVQTTDVVRRQGQAINHASQKIKALSYDGVTTGVNSDFNLLTGKVYKINSVQVVGARLTGWTADTGTAKRTANATYGAGTTLTFSATYVQAELTALATRLAAVETALQNATQTIKALKDDSMTHGLIGA